MPRLPKLPPGLEMDYRLREYVRTYLEPSAATEYRLTHTFGATPDVETAIRHRLGRVPVGYRVIKQDKAGAVYRDTTTKWTRFRVYLKSSAASLTVDLELF